MEIYLHKLIMSSVAADYSRYIILLINEVVRFKLLLKIPQFLSVLWYEFKLSRHLLGVDLLDRIRARFDVFKSELILERNFVLCVLEIWLLLNVNR